MLLVTASHGKEAKTSQFGLNSEGNGNVSPTTNQQGKTTIAANERGRHANLNHPGKAEHSRLLERLASSPSPLPISEAEAETPAVEPEAEAEAWPEPGPDWSKAFGEWGAAWEFHVYLFALVFLGFAIYAAYFVGHGLYVGLHQKYLGFCLNVVMLILGFTRAFVLFTDPYHQGNIISNVSAMRVLWSLASPCLTSADCLVILALVETAKINLAPPKMQKLNAILTIITLHFILVLTTDFVVSEFLEAKAMLVFCQVFFIIWGSILGVGYFLLGYKLDQRLFGHKEVKAKKDVLYIRLIYASGVNNFILSAMFIYASASVFGVYSDVKFVGAWPWWAMQTCFRVSEVLSAILVFTVSAKRKSLKRKTDRAFTNEYIVEDDTLRDNVNELSSISQGTKDKNKLATVTGTKKERKTSMFSHLYSKAIPQNQAKDEVLAAQNNDGDRNMLTDLHEAKIEAYHAHQDV